MDTEVCNFQTRTLPSTNPPKEVMMWWMISTCVQDHKGHKSTVWITALSQSCRTRGRAAPSFLHCSVHLPSTSPYGTQDLCTWPQIFSEALFSPAQVTREAIFMDNISQQPTPRQPLQVRTFPYLFGQLQGEFLLHPFLASFCLSLRAPRIIVMAIFTWLSRYTVLRFSRFLAWMPLPFLLPLLRL